MLEKSSPSATLRPPVVVIQGLTGATGGNRGTDVEPTVLEKKILFSLLLYVFPCPLMCVCLHTLRHFERTEDFQYLH